MAIEFTARPTSITHRYIYWTDVIEADDGTETRISRTGDMFDLIIQYGYNLRENPGIQERLNQMTNPHEEIVIPNRMDEINLYPRDIAIRQIQQPGGTTRFAVLEQKEDVLDLLDVDRGTGSRIQIISPPRRIFLNDEFYFVNSYIDREIRTFTTTQRLFSANRNHFNFTNLLTVVRRENAVSGLSNIVNNEFILTAKAKEYVRPFRNHGRVGYLNDAPFLEQQSYLTGQTQTIEADQRAKVLDNETGGTFTVITKQDRPKLVGQYNFLCDDDEWEDMKAFLNYAKGRLNTFLFRHARADMEFQQFYRQRANSLIVRDEDGRLADKWAQGQRIAVTYEDHTNFYRKVNQIFKISTGTNINSLLLILDRDLPSMDTPDSIALLRVSRLGSDEVTVTYDGNYRYISMIVESVNEPEPEIITSTREFSDDFSQDES